MKVKTWCIEFIREFEGKDIVHIKSQNKPTKEEAINCIKDEGYIFNEGYDEVKLIYEV